MVLVLTLRPCVMALMNTACTLLRLVTVLVRVLLSSGKPGLKLIPWVFVNSGAIPILTRVPPLS